ncbi:hypothetical protein OIV83_000977 [Microbotryomycetes sp. JL201]|nr:hypothetical protein OIV83_000977 [Microbotryomycetes sp. JL201]
MADEKDAGMSPPDISTMPNVHALGGRPASTRSSSSVKLSGGDHPKAAVLASHGKTELGLKRTLKPRHMTFLAIGGAIGTGIFLSVGSSVATAGAGGALIAYMVVGLFCYGTVLTLGEMTSLVPDSGAFATFGTRFVSPVLGFVMGWAYWLQWSASIPSEMIAASVILQFWTDKLKTWQWSLIIIVPVFLFQLLGARTWGESEYFLTLIKVLLIVVFILVGLIYDWGGVANHPGPGLANWNDGPFFSGLAGTAQSFTYAFYSFGGVELVALAAGEAADPQKSIPRAIKATFARIVIFYVLTVLVIGLCVNRKDERLFTAYNDSDVAASPITIVFQQAGFGAAVHVVNAVLLSAVLSATNSCFFASSRMLCALAHKGHAFKILGWTTKDGVPVPALLITLAFSCVSFLTSALGSGATFTWLINITGILALIQWMAIACINLRFRYAFSKQQRPLSDLPFRVWLFPILPVLVIILGCLQFAANAWAITTYGDTGKQLAIDYVGQFVGLCFWIVMGAGYVVYHKLKLRDQPLWVPWQQCDFESGAVWPRGGGQLWKDEQASTKREALQQHGRVGYTLRRVKDGLHKTKQLVFVLLVTFVAIVALVQIVTRRRPLAEQQSTAIVGERKGLKAGSIELDIRQQGEEHDNEDEEDPSDVANRALDALATSNSDDDESDEQTSDDETDNANMEVGDIPSNISDSWSESEDDSASQLLDAGIAPLSISAKYHAAQPPHKMPFYPGMLDRSVLFPGTGAEVRRVLTRAVKSNLYGEKRMQEGSEASEAKYEDEEPFRILVLGGSVSNCRGVEEKTTCWHARVLKWFQDNLPMEGDVPSRSKTSSKSSKHKRDPDETDTRMRRVKRAVEVMQLPVQPPAKPEGDSRRASNKRTKGRARKAKPRHRGQPVTRLINASKSATGSSFFAYCLDEELTARRKNVEWHKGPDLVIIEVGINDVFPLDETATRDFERLLRTLREMPSNPAVIALEAASLLLAQTTSTTSNAEYLHLPAAQFYDVPVLSAKPALFGSVPPLRPNSGVKIQDFFLPDLHHPNEKGHELLADVLINYLEQQLCSVHSLALQAAARRVHRLGLARGAVDAMLDLPRRRDEDVLGLPTRSLFTPFDASAPQSLHLSKPTCLQIGHDRTDVRPIANSGWTQYAWARDKQYLVAEKPGSLVTFSLTVGHGGSILVDYLRSQFYNLGDVLVYLDGDRSKGKSIAGYWDLGWSIGVPTVIFDKISPGRHTVSFELLDAASSSHPRHKTKFRLIGLIST